MNSKNDLTLISNLYSATLNEAAKHSIPKDTFKIATDKNPKIAKAFDKAFVKGTGPENASGVDKNIIDPKTMSKGKMKKNLQEPARFSQKNESKEINTYMSKKFDDLFKDVINDKLRLEDHDIEAVEDIAAMPEVDGAGVDDIDADADADFKSDMSPNDMLDQIQGLLDDLRAKIGDEEGIKDEDEGGFEDDDASLEEGEEDYASAEEGEEGSCATTVPAMEEIEMKEVKNSEGEKLQHKNNKVGGVAGKVAGGKAQNVSDYKVGYNQGEAKESDLHDPKKRVVQSTVKAGRQIGH